METSVFNLHTMIQEFVTPERITLAIRIILIILIGFPLVKIITKITARVIKDKLAVQSEILIKRFVYYLGMLILAVSVLNELGFKLSALLGAAGVLGLAIGFASQTSVSNIISGIFLISEKPFMIGDVVQVGGTIGTLLSIDLLSIKVKTPDNRYVRIPNENMIKTEVINISRFPFRRVNLNISVSYKNDLRKVTEILKDIAANEPLALKEPEPEVLIDRFSESGINFLFGVWGSKDDIMPLKNSLLISVKERFEQEGIEIPYPHVSVIANTP